jgi:diguanylate cyclase (GGDEF)-like protein
MTAAARTLSGRLVLLAATLVLTALALDLATSTAVAPDGALAALLWFCVLFAAFCAAEVQPLHMEWAGQAYSLSLSEVPLVVGLLCFRSPLFIVARVLGSGVALAIHRRQPPVKLGFNIAVQFFEASVALALFSVLPGHAAGQTLSAAPAVVLTVLIASGLSMSAVCAAIRWTVGRVDRAVVWSFAATGIAAIVVNSSIAFVGVAAVRDHHLLAIPLAVVSLAVGAMYRAYVIIRQRHASLGMLYDFTRGLGRIDSNETRIGHLLERTGQMMRAEQVGLLLLPVAPDEQPLLRWVRGDSEVSTEKYVPRPADWPFARLLDHGTALVMARNTRNLGLLSFLQGRGFRDAILAPLRLDNEIRGVLFVADRAGDVATFTRDDGKLFETVAAQVSSVLDNSRLLDQLTYESLHDALTGLVNRQCYQSRLSAALVGDTPKCAVLLADLDRFKEVNDTLGHHHGDLLIREIARRVADTAPAAATVARLGGDEFALLVPGADIEAALELGRLILAAVGKPCQVDGITVDVEASIGIAVSPRHGYDDSVLLKRADMAMYAAKSAGSGVEVYDPERDEYSPRRLALASQLRQAIEHDELTLHYQPQISSAEGRVVSVEALVRWCHPEYGFVSPTEFIPLAEQSGVIVDLTAWVLSHALRQAARWRSDGVELGMSVNISMRNLLDTSVADTISRLLRQHDLPRGALTLEITETHIMTDPARTLPVLHRLSALGARLSVDDFGTGYSSLAYLQQLPVDEIKIDKSFVQEVDHAPGSAAIVQAIVGLANSLDLETVAEGVEDAETAAALVSMGCTRLQGFHISRPVPADDLAPWLIGRLRLPPKQPRARPSTIAV